MKKLLSIIAVGALTTTSALTVVACGSNTKDSEVWVVTDTGRINDKSFNESAYNAANIFLKNDLKRETTSSFLQPPVTSQLVQSYEASRKNGGKGLVLPGYQHAEHIEQASKIYSEGDRKGSVIFLDGSSKSDGKQLDNVIGVLFKAEISGFYAGVASILYNFQNNQKTPVITAYGGGAHSPFATSNALAGYFASVTFMNQLLEQNKTGTTPELLTKLLGIIGHTPEDYKTGGQSVKFSSVQNLGKPGESIIEDNFFTKTFNEGGGTALSTKLVTGSNEADKASVIFPFAGPQTEDTLKVIKDQNSKALVVGADVDQTNLYANYSDKFITSALKDLEGAGRAALIHSKAFEDQEIDLTAEGIIKGTDKNGVEVTGKWDGQDVYFGGKIATGEKNKFKADQANKLMEVLKEAGEKLSEVYQAGENLESFSYVFSYDFITSLATAASSTSQKS
ncbi:ribose/galactose ABC transporter substrate-binding protein [Spiroplasma sabaudiense Ar-1343]|uniref:Ribose/galactose ABC transporter substrate-binding protein n=1 Tax=Spiroplasma sabaudiense Ar-1343 TaxID=1276257 RepID=W6A9C6_9MOLU|nr:BMP family ABC transporter substrate-binding protein [Spiroplasma sabaudiense]AHI53490.1 ribose/galactose ABC transporter substrate-binding protein [Spiroplasma sabaudiense Ar-1343]